ncbi:adenosylcobinamide amidohydrolase [Halorubrum sp. 48-1-W]|uniref:adenosylcobinamide amidohydrolase n=1 Tax=Halorubrum sp. 48-1-W TaxID=2249761 RepID=UPI000DCCFFED|nr:adenosylcobinamide amidohydrolase [Halorubrum sp. 48-1-W]RAW44929.1 adenosylcobinamide amidohydrolase [Halorubrum sp. 48-1-W]
MSGRPPAFHADVEDGVCRFRRTDGPTRFLSTGFDGGVRVADAAYNVTVPEGWDEGGRRDLRAYVDTRVGTAGFADVAGDGAADGVAPALLTGVDQRHARVARLEEATVLATAGVSNPAALPMPADEVDRVGDADVDRDDAGSAENSVENDGNDAGPPAGTVNLLVGADRPLAPGALANLVAVAAEAKAATLLATVGFPGTTSDAVVVGCPAGDDTAANTAFSGSATPIGTAVRACVRDAVHGSLTSRYGPELDGVPGSVATAEYGVVTDRSATVSAPGAVVRRERPDRE